MDGIDPDRHTLRPQGLDRGDGDPARAVIVRHEKRSFAGEFGLVQIADAVCRAIRATSRNW